MKNKNYSIFFILLIISKINFAQLTAITKDGELVILNLDGTWKYKNIDSLRIISLKIDSLNLLEEKTIQVNSKNYEHTKKATHLVKSKKLNVGLYINNKYWGVRRAGVNEYSEYYFFNKIDDGYAYFNSETTKNLSLIEVQKNILKNSQSGMPDAYIKMSEYRIVNGIKVICTNIVGTLNNYKSETLTYSFISKDGIAIVGVGNSQSKFLEFRNVYEDFLNGLVVLE